jgi:hypothetical protein
LKTLAPLAKPDAGLGGFGAPVATLVFLLVALTPGAAALGAAGVKPPRAH